MATNQDIQMSDLILAGFYIGYMFKRVKVLGLSPSTCLGALSLNANDNYDYTDLPDILSISQEIGL